MSHKRSAIECEKGKETWTKNLVQFQNSHKRRNISSEMSPLFERSRLPLQIHITGRYLFLGNNVKSRKDRAKVICNEVIQLWDKFNFPRVSNQVVQSKIEKVLKTYDECVRRGKYSILDELFDITKLDGQWLCSEDKKFYDLQKENKGEVGYVTEKLAGKETIHPSKRIRKTSSTCVASNSSAIESIDVLDSDAITSETEPSDHEDDCESSARKPMRRHYSKTAIATNLVISSKLSTSKAAKVCKQLSNEGINIPTPSQSGIYKSPFREAVRLKEEMKETLQLEDWSLHFDGKHIDAKEYQVVVLKNENREVKLGVLCLANGKAETISDGIQALLDEHNLWSSIKMMVADTTSVNTGKLNGVIVRLQRLFAEKGLDKPQFIGCQHHVLDRILRVVMDDELGGNKTSPNIDYPFVSDIMKKYDKLKANFENGEEEICESSGWHDDMKFLFHLTRVFRFLEENGRFPKVHFRKIPNISNARWNSRAILAILTYILLPTRRESVHKICRFISYDWADCWFSNQMYKKDDYHKLSNILQQYRKALNTLENHWNRDPSVIVIPRSNHCAERAIKVMQELYINCKNKDNLNHRFILSNK